ncbi:threonyl-tRNA synthetase [Candidatus Mycoplasma haematolamae str. Purdue]|uniref:threonine--tRNA ligase n=1 Tax=Mycoplasma haematolamae (strain Purdue) TaxID=1212765 RepID=I7CKN9_MYCHA|nr:aminoacyl--tRNA ligase-related protein [Candidatus Mycoplasma haematolamae]AFO52434.1 threonyl-tRNA synthetase [Candidatus Mycoplasma haematolamae str. Purdue]
MCSGPKFDHRQFGAEKGLFCFPSEGGSGFAFWGPKGCKLVDIVRSYINEFQEKVCGIQLVKTPVLGKKELYKKTGHLELYAENIFPPMCSDKEEFVLRPMTCPHHILLAKELIQGYRQLPFLMGENSILHRNEYSGGLLGLKRVRTMELIDTHIFLMPEHAHNLINSCLTWVWTLLKKFQIEIKEIVLATRSDSQKYLCDVNEWSKSESVLFASAEEWAKKNDLSTKLVTKKGEAAFYGPKIDFNVVDTSNQDYTISTIQLDILMANRLGFTVIGPDQQDVNPWIIHLGLIGTLERFIAYLLERWEGTLPFWLSPQQISIIPIDQEKYLNVCKRLQAQLTELGFRVKIDEGKERFSKKILNSVQERVNIQLLIGEREASSLETISFRELGSEAPRELPWAEFISYLKELNSEAEIKV